MNNTTEHFSLQAKSLKKSFVFGDSRLEVLRSVNLSLRKAESLSIQGDSGCGKSTLLNLLARLEQGDGGEIFWGNKMMEASQKQDAKQIAQRGTYLGVIYQAYYLIPELTVFQNVILPARLNGSLNQKKQERVIHLLQKMGVEKKANQIPPKLSGGERQRVAIARALINSPEVILADEPTGNLDEKTGGEVMDLLLQTCEEEKASLLLVTHNPKFAKATDRAAVLSDGELNLIV
ncbi:MAG: ABC transporter ATP-binding protein [Opitutales bacterium]|nr:ABC transporter ATP-binding protein [Opitutales bacterium]